MSGLPVQFGAKSRRPKRKPSRRRRAGEATAGGVERTAQWRQGDIVEAVYSGDACWYPAHVLRVLDGGRRFAVRFVSYGNTEVVAAAQVTALTAAAEAVWGGYISAERSAVDAAAGTKAVSSAIPECAVDDGHGDGGHGDGGHGRAQEEASPSAAPECERTAEVSAGLGGGGGGEEGRACARLARTGTETAAVAEPVAMPGPASATAAVAETGATSGPAAEASAPPAADAATPPATETGFPHRLGRAARVDWSALRSGGRGVSARPASAAKDAVPSQVAVAQDAVLRKYWEQRRRFFSRFDSGVVMDAEGWYSATPEAIAVHVADRCGGGVVVDACAGTGASAIQFARRGVMTVAIDVDAFKLECVRHNAGIYGVRAGIECVLGDCLHVLGRPGLRVDCVFFAPPWGGPDYSADGKAFNVETDLVAPAPLSTLLRTGLRVAPLVVVMLPRNVDAAQIAGVVQSVGAHAQLESCFINDKLKLVNLYVRPLDGAK